MKAIIYKEYGSPEVLRLVELPEPTVLENQIKIKVMASAVNSADIRLRKADPFLVRLVMGFFRPKNPILGMSFAGVVVEVGKNTSRFSVGDEVFGLSEKKMSTYAQYLCIRETEPVAIKPNNLSFTEAAAIPFGAHTAYYFLRKVDLQIGQSILVYGASGAVGSATVQIAKYFGAEVTAVCGSSNVELVKSLGATHVLDYNKVDIYSIDQKFDVVYEAVNKTNVRKIAGLVKKGGFLVLIAGLVKEAIQSLQVRNVKVIIDTARVTFEDMEFIKNLVETKQLVPTIDREYRLEEMVDAHKYVDAGHKKGNVVVHIDH